MVVFRIFSFLLSTILYQVFTKCHMVMYSFSYVTFCDDQGSKYSLFLECNTCIFVQIKLNSKYGAKNYLLYSSQIFNTISIMPCECQLLLLYVQVMCDM